MTTTATGFPMPKALVVEESSKTATYAKFIAAPFQSGYGHTLGNSLRLQQLIIGPEIFYLSITFFPDL